VPPPGGVGPPGFERLRLFVVLGGAALLVAAWRSISATRTWAFVLDSPLQLRDLVDRMFPPALAYAPEVLEPLLETVHIATLGTSLGVAVALPVAFLAATTTSPLPPDPPAGRAFRPRRLPFRELEDQYP
jgi:phosphonate transport system permease protein